MKSISVFAFLATAFATQVAWAGCEPACPKGQQCRYEASGGGKYYCEALPSNGGKVKPGGGVKPAAPGGAAPGGGAATPTVETPK